MKKICQILWEQEPFIYLFIYFVVYAINSTFFSFILLKFAQIDCIIVMIIPTEDYLSNVVGKGAIWNCGLFIIYAIKSTFLIRFF